MAKTKILIVDDEPRFTGLVRLNLEKTGFYQVQEVNDARQAVAVAEQFQPDLVLLDVMMPWMDGGDVDARLNSHPVLKDVPVIFLTAAIGRSEEGGQGHYQSGGHLFLAKPITLHELIAAIESHLPKNRNQPVADEDDVDRTSDTPAESCHPACVG